MSVKSTFGYTLPKSPIAEYCFLVLFIVPANSFSKILATVPKNWFLKYRKLPCAKEIRVYTALIYDKTIVLFDFSHLVLNVSNMVFWFIISATIVWLLVIENKQVCDLILKQNLSHFSEVRYIDFFYPVLGWASLSLAELVCRWPS
jgi:hypothetical protein